MQQLFTALQPVIRARAERLLLMYSRKRNTRRYELEEVTQDIWVNLFADDARALRSYSPERGMGLLGYVGLIAERTVISMLRGRRDEGQAIFVSADEPTNELPVDEDDACPESKYTRNQAGQRLLQQLRESLGERGNQILELSILQGRPLDEVCASLEMTEEAVYAWRSRILKRAETLLDESSADGTAT